MFEILVHFNQHQYFGVQNRGLNAHADVSSKACVLFFGQRLPLLPFVYMRSEAYGKIAKHEKLPSMQRV